MTTKDALTHLDNLWRAVLTVSLVGKTITIKKRSHHGVRIIA